MKISLLAALSFVVIGCGDKLPEDPDTPRWLQHADAVTITRDDWGIAHVKGKTDADAVFGMIYAQAEDDFNRIEVNYLNAMGRLAEAEGEAEIWRDLRMKLFINPDSIKVMYAGTGDSLKTLMTAWADGLNYFLSTHPEVKPRVLTRFEPWMALTFSEGSIGGDIETISLGALETLYGGSAPQIAVVDDEWNKEPSGSNGIAIAPANTATGNAMLLINPHTSFYFRSELQMTSEEGLNAYGASTWGQFFIYQGFSDKAGWMHTSSGADAIDEYAETVSRTGDGWTYRYGQEDRPVTSWEVTIPFKADTGMASRSFTVYRTHHGPIVREVDGKWIAVRLMQEPVKALTQSYYRTKARGYDEFRQIMDLHTNSSNNTVYADAQGNIAYFHANFVPKRDRNFNWRQPVDGSNPATEWQGLHSVEESAFIRNPSVGWIQNTNNWPYSGSGKDSPRQRDYPVYMDYNTENPRGIHAVSVLSGKSGFTLDSLIAAAYDSYLPAFDDLLPPLFGAWDAAPTSHPHKAALTDQIKELREWDRRWSVSSVPTSLAVYYGEEVGRMMRPGATGAAMSTRARADVQLAALAAASDTLTAHFGKWQTPWGDINRFQRLVNEIVHPFDDSKPSIPVAFTSARWGSLASFGATRKPGTKKMYGTSGNSFVAVVEFGPRVKAKAVTAGGESGDVNSKHFNDQAERYATGNLRDVYFYPEELTGHVESEYKPGKR